MDRYDLRSAGTLTPPVRLLQSLIVSLVMALTASVGLAQVNERAETYEFGVQFANLSGQRFTGAQGASLDVSNDTAIGMIGGYNFTNRFAVMGEIMWADPSYRAEQVLDDASGTVVSVDAELDMATFLVKGVFNFIEEGPFTPYVEAGAGWIRVDSNIVDGPPTTGCWWDPWWGYVCTTWYDTYSDTRTGITYGAGVRWDFSPDIAVRASYGTIDMDTDRALENVSLDTIRLEFVWKFF